MSSCIVCEIVTPDLQGNPWGDVPRGFAVQLSDGKAYWFASLSTRGHAAQMLDAFRQSEDVGRRYDEAPENLPEGVQPATFNEYSEAVGNLAEACLSLQYAPETVARVLESGAVTAKEYPAIIASVMGRGRVMKLRKSNNLMVKA